MDDKRSYMTGDYTNQVNAMDINMKALENNLLHFTIWGYVAGTQK